MLYSLGHVVAIGLQVDIFKWSSITIRMIKAVKMLKNSFNFGGTFERLMECDQILD